MPRLITVCIAIIITSLSLAGMMMARDNPEWLTYDFWFSDGQVKIEVNTEEESWCKPTDFSVKLDNTSTTGGGPVPMAGAAQSLKIPMIAFGSLTVANIVLQRGSVTITDDGKYYTIVNNIGNVAPNEIITMFFNPTNTFFYSSLAFEASISSNTFDPNPNNNSTSLNANFNFNMPATYALNLLGGNGIVLDTPFDYQVNDPQDGLSMRFQIAYDEPDCTIPFENGKLTLTIPNDIGSPIILGSSGGASSTVNGSEIMIQTDMADLLPGEALFVDVGWDTLPSFDRIYHYELKFTAGNIDLNTDAFTQEGSFSVVVEDPPPSDYSVNYSEIINSSNNYLCDPFLINVFFDNGGGVVNSDVEGAVLKAWFETDMFLPLQVEDITVSHGGFTSIEPDGDNTMVSYFIGQIDANDVALMSISLKPIILVDEFPFAAEATADTPDTDTDNNYINQTLNYASTFLSLEDYVELFLDANLVLDSGLNFRVLNNNIPFGFRIELNTETFGCPLTNARLQVTLPTQIGTISLFEPSAESDSFVDDEIWTGFELKADYTPGDLLGIGVRITDPPLETMTYKVKISLTSDEIANGLSEYFEGEGSITIEDQTMPDLKISKAANYPDSSTVAQSDTLIYYLTVTNIGDADAFEVILEDSLPIPRVELEDVETSAGECSEADTLLSCDLGTIAPGDTILVTVRTLAKFPGTIENRAFISTSSHEVNQSNNESNTVVHIIADDPPYADIATEVIILEPDSISVNGYFLLDALLANDGTHDASQVTFQLIFDFPVVIWDYVFLGPDDMDCEEVLPTPVTTFSCSADILEADKAIILFMGGELAGDPAPSAFFTVRSEVNAMGPGDPDESNNEVMTSKPVSRFREATPPIPTAPPEPIPLINFTDLEVTNAFQMPPGPSFVPCLNLLAPAFLVGQNIIHTFTVRNNGPQQALDVLFENDIVFSGVYMDYNINTLTDAMKPKCRMIAGPFAAGTLTCNLGNMNVGDSFTFSIMATAKFPFDPIHNTATVTSDTPDHKPFNNVAVNAVSIFKLECPILYGTDLSITLADVSDSDDKRVSDSDSIKTVEVQIRNVGLTPAYHNVYVDTLPPAMRFVTMSSANATDMGTRCVVEEIDDNGELRHRVQCNWVRHNPGDVKTFYIQGRIVEMGHLDWYSRVRSSNWDTDLSNNLDSLKLNNLLGTSIDIEEADVPSTTTLSQNYPNPFNPSTNITYTLSQAGTVRIDVYSVDGRLVTTVINGYRAAGNHAFTFDASRLSSGVYLYRLHTPTSVVTRKMAVIK